MNELIGALLGVWFLGAIVTPLLLLINSTYDGEPGPTAMLCLLWPLTWLWLIAFYVREAVRLLARQWRE